jgi:asparagine synthase (glutamine-hydrolysing)
MCGLAGLLMNSPRDARTLEGAVAAMTSRLVHRGPDDEGTWVQGEQGIALGFRRLSILDVSRAGHQPMTSGPGRYTVVFNGEIYNFRRLQEHLPSTRFRGGSDTEVLLHAFETWGIEASLPRLIGMFAMAVWDERERELWLIRDRLGIKPLYVATTRAGVAFASELGAIMQAPGFDDALDPDAIRAFLQYLYIPAPLTPFHSVQKLEPGHLLRIRARPGSAVALPRPIPWWSLDDVRARGEAQVERRGAQPEGEAVWLQELEDLLSDSVKLRMVADVPVGALLSGGVDSSLVVAHMQRHASTPVRTFTIGFDAREHDESSDARAVAAHLGTDHTELMVSGRDALELVPDIPSIFDEPLADPSQIPTYLVSALARRDVTVALSGDGGDEVFAGYNRHLVGAKVLPRFERLPRTARAWAGSAIDAIPGSAWSALDALATHGSGRFRLAGTRARKLSRMLGAVDQAEMYRSLLTSRLDPTRLLPPGRGSVDPIRATLTRAGGRFELADMLLCDQRHYLPDDLLQKVDRASMAVSLEMRVPLLDHRIIEFSWSLPSAFKIRNGIAKWPLRQLLYRHVPRDLVDRPKTGFSVPLAQWLAGPLEPWARELLLSRDPVRDTLFDRAQVERSWKAFSGGHADEAQGLWALLMFEAWRTRWGIENLRQAA